MTGLLFCLLIYLPCHEGKTQGHVPLHPQHRNVAWHRGAAVVEKSMCEWRTTQRTWETGPTGVSMMLIPEWSPHNCSVWFMEKPESLFKDTGRLSNHRAVSIRVVPASGLPRGLIVKDPPANEGDTGLVPGSGSSPGDRNVNPLQYSCLGYSMDRKAWRATVRRAAKESDTA